MKHAPSNHPPANRYMQLTAKRRTLAAVVLYLLFTAGIDVAYARIPIEKAMRDLQARYYAMTGQYVEWPPCDCERQVVAPPFPKENYYGDLDEDPTKATELVESLAGHFFGIPIYAFFIKTPDGVTNIEGASGLLPGY